MKKIFILLLFSVFFYLHVCNSVNALICVYPNQVCADGSCHLIGNCPGGGNGTPTCNDWTTIQVNGCTKTMWNANPRASACLTSSVAVRLQLSNSAAKMAFANTSAGTTCSSISDANYSSPVAYSATPTWNLNPQIANHEVCVKLIKANGNSSKCGANIQLVATDRPTGIPVPSNTPPQPIPVKCAGLTGFSDNFSEATHYDTTKWTKYSTNSKGLYTGQNGVLTLSVPAKNSDSLFETNLHTTQKISGDFIAEITLNSVSFLGDSMVSSIFSFSDSKTLFVNNWINFSHIFGVERQSNYHQFYASSYTNKMEGSDVINLPSDSVPVKVKMQRIGSTVSFFYDLNGKGYALYKSYPAYSGAGYVTIAVKNIADPKYSVSAGFKNFTLACPTPPIPTLTPVPTLTPILTPVSSCLTRSQGDANCDGLFNDMDFGMFTSAMKGLAYACSNCSADFNTDGKVDLVDYEIWRNTVYH